MIWGEPVTGRRQLEVKDGPGGPSDLAAVPCLPTSPGKVSRSHSRSSAL